MLRPVDTVCVKRDEDWSSSRCISPEFMGRLSGPATPEHTERAESRRRGLMIVETTIGLAGSEKRAARCYDADGFGRRPAPRRRVTPTYPTLPPGRTMHNQKPKQA